MKRRVATVLFYALLLTGIAVMAGIVVVQSYGIAWWTVDSGGDLSSSGDYTLRGTIGQPDPVAMSGGEYALAGGFWKGGERAVESRRSP